jgi:hypothetical protein
MFKWIKRFFGLDYNDNVAPAEKHSGIGYTGSPALGKVMEFEGVKNDAPVAEARPAVEDKGTLPAVKKAPKKPAAKKAAPKKAAKKSAK